MTTPTLSNEDEARAWLAAEIGADSPAMARLERLVALLAQENARQNLVSAASMEEVWLRHIVDSAQLLRYVPRETSAGFGDPVWLDLGTGAGFPGLVVAALRPEMDVRLVESRGRRIEWLEHARSEMELAKAKVIGQRLELVPTEEVGVISARAFAPLDKLLSLSARFSTGRTIWLLPKGRSAAQELEALSTGGFGVKSGFEHQLRVEASLTDPEAGILVGQVIFRRGVKV